MPFRHLLFNRRNGAPQRQPNQQAMSLDQAAFFSLDTEFQQYNNRWPDPAQNSPDLYNTMMHNPHTIKSQPIAVNEPYDQPNMFTYNPMNGVPYQKSPYDFDSTSLQYSSDMMDTDVSSISRGSINSSISSVSHLDVMLDDEVDSIQSLSRKQSFVSSFDSDVQTEGLCPLITGQVGKCSPEVCGPTAPCLQYVNDEVVPPIEECVRDQSTSSSTNEIDNQAIDFTTPHISPGSQTQRSPQRKPIETVNPAATLQAQPPVEDEKKARLRARRTTNTKATTTDTKDDVPMAKQTKKTRARQAHSLVERKYRENLNAKIQELHQTLQKVQLGRTCSRNGISHSHDDDDDDDDDERSSTKVKKSDVLVEAMNYVHAAEAEMRRKDNEIQKLNERVKMMEKWFQNGPLDMRNMI